MADPLWLTGDLETFDRVKQEVASVQPLLRWAEEDGATLLRGTFEVREGQVVHAAFDLEVVPSPDGPHGVPTVREIGGRIPRLTDPHHVNTDGTLCVVLPDAYWFDYPGGLSLAAYFDGPLRAHLAGQELVLLGEGWPAGEWSHGDAGVREFYGKLLEAEAPGRIEALLELVTRDLVPRFIECPCGSRNTVSECHRPILLDLHERLPRALRLQAWRMAKKESSPASKGTGKPSRRGQRRRRGR